MHTYMHTTRIQNNTYLFILNISLLIVYKIYNIFVNFRFHYYYREYCVKEKTVTHKCFNTRKYIVVLQRVLFFITMSEACMGWNLLLRPTNTYLKIYIPLEEPLTREIRVAIATCVFLYKRFQLYYCFNNLIYL